LTHHFACSLSIIIDLRVQLLQEMITLWKVIFSSMNTTTPASFFNDAGGKMAGKFQTVGRNENDGK